MVASILVLLTLLLRPGEIFKSYDTPSILVLVSQKSPQVMIKKDMSDDELDIWYIQYTTTGQYTDLIPPDRERRERFSSDSCW